MKITVDFKNLLSELELKNLKLCLLKRKWLCIEDNQKNLYQMETYRIGSYLDKLIKEGITVKFHQVENSNIKDWEKEIWNVSEVESFINRQCL